MLYTAMTEISESYFKDLMCTTVRLCDNTIPNQWQGVVLPYREPSFKKRHYWLWSDNGNVGKTTFLKGI